MVAIWHPCNCRQTIVVTVVKTFFQDLELHIPYPQFAALFGTTDDDIAVIRAPCKRADPTGMLIICLVQRQFKCVKINVPHDEWSVFWAGRQLRTIIRKLTGPYFVVVLVENFQCRRRKLFSSIKKQPLHFSCHEQLSDKLTLYKCGLWATATIQSTAFHSNYDMGTFRTAFLTHALWAFPIALAATLCSEVEILESRFDEIFF